MSLSSTKARLITCYKTRLIKSYHENTEKEQLDKKKKTDDNNDSKK